MNHPRGIRNNNPLNIRRNPANGWRGRSIEQTDKDFEQFVSMLFGLRAAICILRNYLRSPMCSTLTKVISRWAPPSENVTTKYIKYVSDRTGIDPSARLVFSDKDKICRIVQAMAEVECGKQYESYFPLSLIYKAYDMS